MKSIEFESKSHYKSSKDQIKQEVRVMQFSVVVPLKFSFVSIVLEHLLIKLLNLVVVFKLMNFNKKDLKKLI